ncbi:MAG TPA: biopolymer transporter ExbD [Planctomycetaceae bacterium]|nr:biopolymer transporter ExbD [Planctomycetaceae bacterium]
MRIPSYLHHEDVRQDQTMAPLIDVVFLLLIFFVCASIGQIRDALLPTELAGGGVAAAEPLEPERPFGEVWLFLSRTGDGRTRVQVNEGGQTYDVNSGEYQQFRQVIVLLSQQAADIPVNLDIAPDVPLGDMIRVYDACYAAEFRAVNFAIDPEQLPRAGSGSQGSPRG